MYIIQYSSNLILFQSFKRKLCLIGEMHAKQWNMVLSYHWRRLLSRSLRIHAIIFNDKNADNAFQVDESVNIKIYFTFTSPISQKRSSTVQLLKTSPTDSISLIFYGMRIILLVETRIFRYIKRFRFSLSSLKMGMDALQISSTCP